MIQSLIYITVWFSLKKDFHMGELKFSTRPCKTLNPKFSFQLKHPSLFVFNSV